MIAEEVARNCSVVCSDHAFVNTISEEDIKKSVEWTGVYGMSATPPLSLFSSHGLVR